MTPTLITAETFREDLRAAAKAAAKAGVIPASKMLRLRPVGHAVEIAATDCESTLFIETKAAAGAWPAVCVAPDALIALMGAMAGEVEVWSAPTAKSDGMFDEDGPHLFHVRHAGGRIQNGALAGGDWPEPKGREVDFDITLPAAAFREILDAAVWAMEEKGIDYNAVALTFAPDSMSVEATDGKVAAFVKFAAPFPVAESRRITINAEATPSLRAMIAFANDNIIIGVGERHIEIREGRVVWQTLIRSNNMANVANLFEKSQKVQRTAVSFESHAIKQAIRRSKLYANFRAPRAAFAFSQSVCTITTEDLDGQKAAEDRVNYDAEGSLDGRGFAFSPEILGRALSAYPADETITLQVAEGAIAAIMEKEWSDFWLGYLIMPLN